MKRLNLLCSLSAIGIIIVLLFLLNGCRSRKEIGDITPSKEKTEIVFQKQVTGVRIPLLCQSAELLIAPVFHRLSPVLPPDPRWSA